MDAAWKTCGAAAEIIALVAETSLEYLKAPLVRVTLPDVPAPASPILEDAYYLNSEDVISAVKRVLGTELRSKAVADPR